MVTGPCQAHGVAWSMTSETQQAVLVAMHSGLSLRKACLAVGCAVTTFLDVVARDTALAEQYACARADLIERMADELLEIADHPPSDAVEGAAARLRVDTRKWLLSKIAAKKYGDRVEVEATVKAVDPFLAALVALAKPPKPEE